MDIPIDILNTEVDVSSGQHTPASTLWSVPNDVEIEEDEEIVKEALGILDIPASTNGGEVLDFQGIPENPGLSRELGEGEETDLFGADSPEDALPPINELDKLAKYLKKEDLLKLKSVIKMAENIRENNSGEHMKSELEKLENFLRNSGKDKQANSISNFQKEAQSTLGANIGGATGAVIGGGLGLFSGLLPGVGLVPTPVRVILGSTLMMEGGMKLGQAIDDYFRSNPRLKTTLDQQSTELKTLEAQLRGYGVQDAELQQLADGKLQPQALIDSMTLGRNKLPAAWKEPTRKAAEKYIYASSKLTQTITQAKDAVSPKSYFGSPELANKQEESDSPTPGPDRKPIASGARGSISRPGDPYTYDKSGDGYVIVSAPAGQERLIGRKIMPGQGGYEEIKAADNSAKPISDNSDPNKTKARELFLQAQEKATQKQFAEAAELYQQSYDTVPNTDTLYNIGKSYHDAGNLEKAKEVLQKYKEQDPQGWEKNKGSVPNVKLDEQSTTQPISNNVVPQEYTPTKEKIQEVLSNFLNGVPIRMQTADGTTTTMDSKKVRRLAERYIEGVADTKNTQEVLPKASESLMTEFGPAIEAGLSKMLAKGEMDPKQMSGVFNGLIWQALRKGWAKWKDAPLKDHPTERSEQRRLNKIERQDDRAERQGERQLRRESAQRKSRQLLVEELFKSSKG